MLDHDLARLSAKILLGSLSVAGASALLIFWPAGDFEWPLGWRFLALMAALFTVSALVLASINPAIFGARSGFQEGTQRWDFALLSVLLPTMAAILPVAGLDASRFGWSHPPQQLVYLGYGFLVVAITVQTWAQAVNPFFEQGARIQSDRNQRAIESGPYGFIRHPGYASAFFLLSGASLALGSYWGLVPTVVASALLVVRTSLEDRMLQKGLPGYLDYARRTRYRLLPFVW